MEEKKRKLAEDKVFNLIYPSLCLDESELAVNLGISRSSAASLIGHLTEAGRLKVFSGYDVAKLAKDNSIYIKGPKMSYVTPTENLEIAKNKEVVRIVREKIEEDYASIDREIEHISGKNPYHALDYPMELLDEARAKGAKKLEDFVMKILDSRMKSIIHTVEKRIDETESLRKKIEKFEKNNQCF
jgi:hypothetical protein